MPQRGDGIPLCVTFKQFGKMQLVKTDIAHNERWPRKGVMYAPQFILKSGDELIFNWVPVNNEQKLKIGIESNTSIEKIELPTIRSVVIKNNKLVSILIENLPEYKLYGHLTITLKSEHNRNPFPETRYNYEYITQNEAKTKKCINSHINKSEGANTILKSDLIKLTNPLFNSENEKFDEIFSSDRFLYKQKLFKFKKGERIHITFKRPRNKNIYVGVSIERVNSKGTQGEITENCFFICNTTDYYILEIFKYPTELEIELEEFGEIKLYSNMEERTNISYEIVYNELFRKKEIEPIEASL